MLTLRIRQAAALLLFVPTAALAQSLGTVEFATSAQAPAAQAAFERGLLLLHSFEYADARDAFREARSIEPAFAMAAWGEAMTHNRPIWMQQDLEDGRRVLGALGDGLAITDRESRYLEAARVLFASGGDKEARDDAYAQAMADLAADYPEDLDAQAFWALAILGTAHEGRDFPTYMRAAAILEEVFAASPEHPGAAHYLIHAYDDPVHAPLGLRPASVYAEVAPDASHALHMPSHIYLSLGMWDETADLNRRSFEAARANSERRGETLNNHGWHALWWWHYAELQRGNVEEAIRLKDLAVELAGTHPSELAAAHLTRIGAQHHLVTGEIDFVDFPAQGTSPSSVATFYQAYGAALPLLSLGQSPVDQNAMMEELARGVESVHAAYRDATETGADAPWTVRVVDLYLTSLAHTYRGDLDAAIAVAREAATLEAEAPLTFGPPVPAIGANEWLATVLMMAGRPAEAIAAYEAALDRAPGRPALLEGLDAARSELAKVAEQP